MKINTFSTVRETKKFIREWVNKFDDNLFMNQIVVHTNKNKQFLGGSNISQIYENKLVPLTETLDECSGIMSLVQNNEGHYGLVFDNEPYNENTAQEKYTFKESCRIFENDDLSVIEDTDEKNNPCIIVMKNKIIKKFESHIPDLMQTIKNNIFMTTGIMFHVEMRQLDDDDEF
jgi:hypothetical protein